MAAIMLALLPASAQMMDDQPVAGSRSFSHQLDGAEVSSQIKLRVSPGLAPGQRGFVQVDFETSLASGAGSLTRSGVVNGFVVFALPPGLEPLEEPRLLYYNPQRGAYDYMYSRTFPDLRQLKGKEGALADAVGNSAGQIFDGLASVSQALDPNVIPTGPSDPRLSGAERSYTLTGISWLVPCNVSYQPVVNLFSEEPGLMDNARLRVTLPVTASENLSGRTLAVFTSGLSTAVKGAQLLPQQLPATAIPLVPLPEPGPIPPAAGQDGAVQPGAADDAGGDSGSPAGNEDTPAPADGQDEQSAVEVELETAPPPPEPIPCLLYATKWIAWETEYELGSGMASMPTDTLQPQLPDTASSGQVDPMDPTEVQLPDNTTGGTSGQQQTQSDPGGLRPAGGQREAQQPASQPVQQPPPAQPPATSLPAQQIVATEQPLPAGDGSAVSVRQVAPGTLPTEPEEYTVPLKPISGYSAGTTPVYSQPATPASPPDGYAMQPTGGYQQQPQPTGGYQPQPGLPPPAGLGEMVLIPAGEFIMGTPANASQGDDDEAPQHTVNLPAYYIDKYPVTNRQFHDFVLSAGYKPEGHWDRYYSTGTADMPVRGVSWNDAATYAQWAGKRLPTEAQWEKAARGTDGRLYPWGDDWASDILPRGDETAMYSILSATATASPYGVMGMSGLVWQWTASPYVAYPFNSSARGGEYVLRGGAYSNGRSIVRCANRYAEQANVALNTFGFRCVRDG